MDVFTLTNDPIKEFTTWIVHFEEEELGIGGKNAELEMDMGIDFGNGVGFSGENREVENNGLEYGSGYEEENENENSFSIQNFQSNLGKSPAKKVQKRFTTYAYAHAGENFFVLYRNLIFIFKGSKYDNVFVFGEVIRTLSVCPKMIRSGNRLYQMEIHSKGMTRTIFRDSYA